MSKFLAGAGKAPICFPDNIAPMEGFYKVHDDPMVRILCLDQGTRFVIAAFELVILPDDLLADCKAIIGEALQVAEENIWLHVNHTISTPHSPGGPLIGPGGEVRPIPPEMLARLTVSIESIVKAREDYCTIIKDALRKACEEAADLKEARIGLGKGGCDVNENRDIETPNGWWIGRHGKGYSNKEMNVIQLVDPENRKIAGIISYGIKPCVIDNSQMRDGKRQISADLTGAACRILEQHWNAPVMFLMSAAGDQIPKKTVLYEEVNGEGKLETHDLGVEQGLVWAQELGAQMAEDALDIGSTIVCEELSGGIACSNGSFKWAGKVRSKMEPTMRAEYVPERERQIPLSVLKIGRDLAFVATQPEMNAVSERELQEKSPVRNTLLVTMVNGEMKYLPDRESYDRVTWEALTSMLMPGGAEELINKALEMLHTERRT